MRSQNKSGETEVKLGIVKTATGLEAGQSETGGTGQWVGFMKSNRP